MMASSSRVHSPLEKYYMERRAVDSLELPWNVKRQMSLMMSRPVHPTARAMHRFIDVWNDTFGRKRIDEDTTPFGSGTLVNIIGMWSRKTGYALSLEFTGLCDDIITSQEDFYGSEGQKRAIFEFYDICGEYDNFAYMLPSYYLLDLKLRGV